MTEIHFAENLRNLRKEKRWSQAFLGKLIGVDQRTISAWENGVCEPSFSLLAKLCDIFKESFEGLLI